MADNKAKLVDMICSLLERGGQENLQAAMGLTRELREYEAANTASRLEQLAAEVRELLDDGSLKAIDQALEKLDEMFYLTTGRAVQPRVPEPVPVTPLPFAGEEAAYPEFPVPEPPPLEISMREEPRASRAKASPLQHKVVTAEDIIVSYRDTHPLRAVALSGVSNHIALANSDSWVRCFEIREGSRLEQVGEFQGSAPVTKLFFHPQDPTRLIAAYGSVVSMISFKGKFPRVLGRFESLNPILGVGVSPNGKLIAFSNTAGALGLLYSLEEHDDPMPRKLELVVNARLREAAESIDFSRADMRKIAVGGVHGSCQVVSLADAQGKKTLPELVGYSSTSPVTAVSYRPNGNALTIGTKDGQIEVLAFAPAGTGMSSTHIGSRRLKSAVSTLSSHPRRAVVAVGTEKGEMLAFAYGQEATGSEGISLLAEYNAEFTPCLVAFHRDGTAVGVGNGNTFSLISLF